MTETEKQLLGDMETLILTHRLTNVIQLQARLQEQLASKSAEGKHIVGQRIHNLLRREAPYLQLLFDGVRAETENGLVSQELDHLMDLSRTQSLQSVEDIKAFVEAGSDEALFGTYCFESDHRRKELLRVLSNHREYLALSVRKPD